jgi:hypothetical protein
VYVNWQAGLFLDTLQVPRAADSGPLQGAVAPGRRGQGCDEVMVRIQAYVLADIVVAIVRLFVLHVYALE